MNFECIPGSGDSLAFWEAVVAMFSVAAILVWVFCKKRWF